MGQRPTKDPGALEMIRAAVAKGRCIELPHATQRLNERHVDRLEIKHVLLNGKRNTHRDELSEKYNTWKYTIEGSTLDRDKHLRIIVTLQSDPIMGDMVRIVSVIDITK